MLEQAQKDEEEGKFLGAADLYRRILNKFPDTKAAERVRTLVGETVDDDLFRAKSLLYQAQKLEKSGAVAEAKAKYAEVKSKYPKTESAKIAKTRLAEIAKKTGE